MEASFAFKNQIFAYLLSSKIINYSGGFYESRNK